MSIHTRLLEALVLHRLPFAVRERFALNTIKAARYATGSVRPKVGKHRTQTLRRNQVVRGDLCGMALPDAYLRPAVLANLRHSKGSQAVLRARRARRNAERAA